jgi:excisionase family DNA binding protein
LYKKKKGEKKMGSLLTVKEAASRLKMSQQSAYRLIREGRCGAVVRLSPRRIRISEEMLNRWIESQAKQSEPQLS